MRFAAYSSPILTGVHVAQRFLFMDQLPVSLSKAPAKTAKIEAGQGERINSNHGRSHAESVAADEFQSPKGVFELTVEAAFRAAGHARNGTLIISLPALNKRVVRRVFQDGGQGELHVNETIRIPAENVELWWPVGYGGQRLYEVHVNYAAEEAARDASATGSSVPSSFNGYNAATIQLSNTHDMAEDGKPSASAVGVTSLQESTLSPVAPISGSGAATNNGPEALPSCQRVVRKIGFRVVELVRQPVDLLAQDPSDGPDHQPADTLEEEGAEGGESFSFKINGLPIFVKGANLIPTDVIPAEVSRRRLRRLLQQALDGNHNMVRIWGGGMYQLPELYEFCDLNGLMVWQEAMFACNPYPRWVHPSAAYAMNAQQIFTILSFSL